MDNILVQAASLVGAPVLSVVIALLVREPLKERLAPIVMWLGSKQESGVTGLWIATFTFGPQKTEYQELIEVRSLFGSLVGRILPSELNHSNAAKVASKKPLRVRGSLKDNRFFTGVWLHPSMRSHHHGTFNLILNLDGNSMDGVWLGYSESQSKVDSGSWTWKRVE